MKDGIKEKISDELVYGAQPFRLMYQKEKIMRFFHDQGKVCLHPFNALPYEFTEGGNIGRTRTLQLGLRLINVCDTFALCGISEGTLLELRYFLNKHPGRSIIVLVKEFDPDWKTYYSEYYPEFNAELNQLGISL